MTHQYSLTGMTCESCEAKIKSALLLLPQVVSVHLSRKETLATIEMNEHIPISQLQQAIGGSQSKYQISALHHNETTEQVKNWFQTYKPVLLIFAYLTGISFLATIQPHFNIMRWMNHFMAGFFLVFSFFKLLNISGFATSYAMYDVLARRWKFWGYIYPFIELLLGIALLSNISPLAVNAVTLIVMLMSIIGVLQSLLNKQRIRCACLGDVFNLPMSTITVMEDALMILMSAATILFMVV